jgi:hypothetical protein
MPSRSDRRPTIGGTRRRRSLTGSAVVGVLLALVIAAPVAAADVTRPRASLIGPSPTAPIARDSRVRLLFSEPVIGTTIGIIVSAAGRAVPGSVRYDRATRVATWTATKLLPADALLTVRARSPIRDLSGNAIAYGLWAMRTSDDRDRPTVRVTPSPGSAGVQPWSSIVVRFDEWVRDAARTTLLDGITGAVVPASLVEIDEGQILRITPRDRLQVDHPYAIAMPPTARDRAGNSLRSRHVDFQTSSEPYAHTGPSFSYRRDMPVSVWHVPRDDLPLVAALGATVVIKKLNRGEDVLGYLDAAKMAGVKALLGFDWVYEDGLDLGAAKGIARSIARHPALYGILAVTEPEQTDLSRTELRALYRAYKGVLPRRPVMASLGSIRDFPGWARTHWGPGIADAVICEWYPVVRPSRRHPTGWVSGSTSYLRAWKRALEATAPDTPVWGSIAIHRYDLARRRSPNAGEVADQARDAFRYLGATGLSIYPWNTAAYENDLRRDPARRAMINRLVGAILAGTL